MVIAWTASKIWAWASDFAIHGEEVVSVCSEAGWHCSCMEHVLLKVEL